MVAPENFLRVIGGLCRWNLSQTSPRSSKRPSWFHATSTRGPTTRGTTRRWFYIVIRFNNNTGDQRHPRDPVPKVARESHRRFFFFFEQENWEQTWVKSHRTRYKASSISDGSPAKVAEHIRHSRRVAVCAQIAMQTKQRTSEGPGSGTRQDGAPSVQPRLAGASAQHLRNGPSLGLGEKSEEGLRLLRETTSCLPCNDNEFGTTWTCELRIGAFLAPSGKSQRSSVLWHQRGVDRQLSHVENGKPLSDHLDPALIHGANGKVEVAQEHVHWDSGAGLAANARYCRLQCEATPPKDPCPRATCVVVAKAVEWTATPADAGGQWERKVKATKKEDPEQVRLEPVEGRDGQSGEREARERTSLWPEHGPSSWRGRRDDRSFHEALLQNQRSVMLPLLLWNGQHTWNQRGCSASANSTSDNSSSASWPKSNWPKSKLAEVEIGRSRTDGVCSVSSFSLSFFSFCFVFSSLFFFLVLTHLSLHFVFLCCFCFRPQKLELNPKPRTLHPISDGPTLRQTTLRRTAQNFALLFPSSHHNFHSSFSLLGSFRGILLVFLKAGTLKCAHLGSRAVVWSPGSPTRPGRRGSHTTTRELQTCTFQFPGASKTPPKFHGRTPIVAGGGGKKREILGPPPFGAPFFGAPFFGAPRGRDFLGKCVGRDSSSDHPQCQEP